MDNISSEVHRVHMELGGKLLNSENQDPVPWKASELQSVSIVDGATHTQEDDVQSNVGSLENVAEIFGLFLCDVQLVLRSGVFTILDMMRWMSRRVLLRSLGRCCLGLVALLVAGGAARVLPVSLKCPLPLWRTHPPTSVCCVCVFAAIGVTSTNSGRLEVILSLSGKRGGKSYLGTILLLAVSDFAWPSVCCYLHLWRQRIIPRSLFCW